MSGFTDPGLRSKAAYIGEKGWVLPFQLAPGNVKLLLDDITGDSAEDIDQMFITFYNDWMLLPRVFTSLQTESHFQKYNALVAQAVTSYAQGQYALVVGALVPLIEGLLADLTNEHSQSMKTKLEMMAKAATNDTDVLTAPVMLSLYAFLKPLYSSSDFTKIQPSDLNRHWISHGRATIESNQADALKIINAVNCLGYAVKFLAK